MTLSSVPGPREDEVSSARLSLINPGILKSLDTGCLFGGNDDIVMTKTRGEEEERERKKKMKKVSFGK